MSRRILGMAAAVPLALTLALALTGCGSDGGGDGKVASAGGAKKSGGADSGAGLSPQEMGVKFAQCMREHGIDMEDPEPGKGVTLDIPPGTPKGTVEKAQEACREYDPVQNGGGRKPDAKAQENMRKYAQCMRERGVEEFPDPSTEGGIRLEGTVMDDPDFKKAEKACNKYMGGGGTLHKEKG
ncbi:hypothetical protein [Streptomyces sp. ME19-01-6]|uniref:hypothetical protein n=1 Tax=Streptomyces sp. ME19-01-6 TaxID=3028686 RepID=UPI0029A2E1C9|nr:hypothetical protein [Streptomyces sp. ME19-01-6]MDX3226793.1 hypothetical protein [Streptomyces sp. ME19-01-6]